MPISVWILVGLSPQWIGSPVCEEGADSGFVDVPGLLVKHDTGDLSVEEESVDVEIPGFKLVALSSVKRHPGPGVWPAESLFALLQIPANSGLGADRDHRQAGRYRQEQCCFSHRHSTGSTRVTGAMRRAPLASRTVWNIGPRSMMCPM